MAEDYALLVGCAEHLPPPFRKIGRCREIASEDVVTVIRFSQVVEDSAARRRGSGNGHGRLPR
jgi:hypothetical protein